ncbi:hypothetical protein Lepto7375DRAFT_7206 [Leptolyngbya sp. PCC 7375]|nr:hypothetical protein Lepto7375DRAFT_7206 [Leptolyngbya sp. PCC 7375]
MENMSKTEKQKFLYKYTEALKSFINYCLENYFNDNEPANLNEMLSHAGIPQYYVKIYGYVKRDTPLKSVLDYETFVQLSRIDPKHRAPLEIRNLLMGVKTPDYASMDKKDLINLLIDKKHG